MSFNTWACEIFNLHLLFTTWSSISAKHLLYLLIIVSTFSFFFLTFQWKYLWFDYQSWCSDVKYFSPKIDGYTFSSPCNVNILWVVNVQRTAKALVRTACSDQKHLEETHRRVVLFKDSEYLSHLEMMISIKKYV